MIIRIGSDEIILWLRKNNKCSSISNDSLGKNLRKYIEKNLGGKLVEEDTECYWPHNGVNIGEYLLPQTAAQYEIDTSKIAEIYEYFN